MTNEFGLTGDPFPPERNIENVLSRHYEQGGSWSARDARRENVAWRDKTIGNRRRVLAAWRKRGFSSDEAHNIATYNIQLNSPLGRKMIGRRREFMSTLRRQGFDASEIVETIETNSIARFNIETYILDLYEGLPEVVETRFRGSINESERLNRVRSRSLYERAKGR